MSIEGVISRIEESSFSVVEIPSSGLDFRIRRVCSADLMVHGEAQLLSILKPSDLSRLGSLSAEDAQTLAYERFRNLSPADRQRMANSEDALVLAGVVAYRLHPCPLTPQIDPDPWSAVRIVRTESKEANGSGGAELSLDALPRPVRRTLAEQIREHSYSEEGLAAALDKFRSNRASGGRPDSQSV